jgi:Zn-dependent protease
VARVSDLWSRVAGAPRTRRQALTPSPVFVLFVALTVLGAVLASTGDSLRQIGIGVFLFVVAGWVVTLCLHEFAHAVTAYKAGDTDVLSAGYLTLNPLLYGNVVFSVVLPIVFVIAGGIGLPGGAVYLHRHRFRSRGLASAVSLAGPGVNLVLAVVLLAAVRAHGPVGLFGNFGVALSDGEGLWAGIAFLGLLQVTAAILNLLPVPGLDGWGAVEPWVSRETAAAAAKIAPLGLLAVFAVLFWFPGANEAFFSLVYAIFDLTGVDRSASDIGASLFRFWNLSG